MPLRLKEDGRINECKQFFDEFCCKLPPRLEVHNQKRGRVGKDFLKIET